MDMDRYSRTFQDPLRALVYREKFKNGLFRRWTHRKERSNLAAALEAAGLQEGQGLVLDVPCGTGRWADLLGKAGKFYLGLDLSFPMLLICREWIGDRRPVALASAWALPLPDGGADLVACIRLLHHVGEEERKRALVGELCRVARRALLVTFLDGRSPKQRIHRWKARLMGKPVRRPAWNRKSLEEAARERGMTLVRYWTLSPWFSGQTLALFRREDRL